MHTQVPGTWVCTRYRVVHDFHFPDIGTRYRVVHDFVSFRYRVPMYRGMHTVPGTYIGYLHYSNNPRRVVQGTHVPGTWVCIGTYIVLGLGPGYRYMNQ
jgi:hypothetical protein